MSFYIIHIPGMIINGLVLSISVLIINHFFREHYWKARINKYRFKLFEIRDKINLLVLNGKMKKESHIYITFINFVNYHIKSLSDYSIIHFCYSITEFLVKPNVLDNIKIFLEDINIKNNSEVKDLFIESVNVLKSVLFEASFIIRFIYYLYYNLNFINNLSKYFPISFFKKADNTINSYYNYNLGKA